MFAEEAVDATTTAAKTSAAEAGLADSYDDVDGYYNLQVRCLLPYFITERLFVLSLFDTGLIRCDQASGPVFVFDFRVYNLLKFGGFAVDCPFKPPDATMRHCAGLTL